MKYTIKRKIDNSIIDRAPNKIKAIELCRYYEEREETECYYEEDNNAE